MRRYGGSQGDLSTHVTQSQEDRPTDALRVFAMERSANSSRDRRERQSPPLARGNAAAELRAVRARGTSRTSLRRALPAQAPARYRTGWGGMLCCVFERFSDRARQVVAQTADAARSRNDQVIGTEHLLLGLTVEDQGIAARILDRFHVTSERVEAELNRLRAPGTDLNSGQIPFSAEGKQALELSLEEATNLGSHEIRPEHLLLALLRVEDTGLRVLFALDTNLTTMRAELIRLSRNRKSLLDEAHQPKFGRWEPVGPTDPLHQILVAAAEVAVDCGRSTIDVSDVLFAIANDRSAMPLLAELGVQIEEVAGVMARHRARTWPPEPDTES
jgi:hypothetical protein